MEDPILATMNTSDTTERPCVEETSGSIRLCIVKSLPALRTGFSEDLSKRKPLSEKGGEMDTLCHSTTRNAEKRKDQSKASGGVKPKDTIKSKPSYCQIQLDDKEGSQELIECTTSEENKVQESIQMNGDTPVGGGGGGARRISNQKMRTTNRVNRLH
jgi:hypothetical protein